MSEILKAVNQVGKSVDGIGKKVDDLETRVKKVEKWGEKAAVNSERLYAVAKSEGSEEARFGFKSFKHFCTEIYQAGVRKAPTETLTKAYQSEMVQKAAQGMGELVGSDGGFLVPPEFSNKIFERTYENSLLEKTDQYTISSNSITFPRNAESSRATGSRFGGVQAYWRQEGGTNTQSRPTFGRLTLNLHKLVCMAALTDELIADASMSVEQYVVRCFSDELKFVIGDAIINGTGAGMPLGILNSPCLVSVSKETGQSAATLNTQNIVKMWARLWAGCRQNAIWLINQDIEPQLFTMTLGIGTAGVVTYMPPGGLSQQPYATLMGRPVIPTEFNATLGTVGDIILVDLSHYVTATKGGMQSSSSMHLYFDTDEQAFKTVFRLDGQPWWASALTPYKGTNTQSCAVALATRS